MRQMAFALVVMLACGSPGVAAPLTGSGTVEFTFSSFRGPFNVWGGAVGDLGHLASNSTVNGLIPTYDSSVSQVANNVYGSAPVSGTSVNFNQGAGFLANVVSFAVAPTFTNLAQGEDFKIGTFTFQNGTWFGSNIDTALDVPARFAYTITTHSTTPQFNQTVNGVLKATTNFNTDCTTGAGRQDAADFISIEGQPLGSLRVYDNGACSGGNSSIGTIELWMKFNSLDYVALRNPQGGFFVPNDNVGPVGGVPEPAAWTLLVAGFGLIGAVMRHRRPQPRARSSHVSTPKPGAEAT